jgi:hypothetical protein
MSPDGGCGVTGVAVTPTKVGVGRSRGEARADGISKIVARKATIATVRSAIRFTIRPSNLCWKMKTALRRI